MTIVCQLAVRLQICNLGFLWRNEAIKHGENHQIGTNVAHFATKYVMNSASFCHGQLTRIYSVKLLVKTLRIWGSADLQTCELRINHGILITHDSFSEVEIKDLFYISCLIFFFKSCNFIIVPPYLLTTTNSIDSLTSLWKVKRTWGNFRNFLGIFWQVDRKSATTNW